MMKELSGDALTTILAWATSLPEQQISESLKNGNSDWQAQAARAVSEHCAGAPLSYVMGQVRYFGRVFRSDPRALAIRPYTEVFVRQVIEDWQPSQPNCLEIGCGAGAIIITLALELRGAFVATDVDGAALKLAQENAAALSAPVEFVCSDLFNSVEGRFDVIVSSLPWQDPERPVSEAAWEPDQALYDRSGLSLGLIRRFLRDAPAMLRPKGLVYLEVPEAPQEQGYFAGQPLALSSGEVVGFRMNAEEICESSKRLEEKFGTQSCRRNN